MTSDRVLLLLRTGRRLAGLSLGSAALSLLAFVIGESFLWNRPTKFAFENVMDTGVAFMAISAVLGVAAFTRAGDGGVRRPAMIRWTFALSMLFVPLLIMFLITFLGLLPSR